MPEKRVYELLSADSGEEEFQERWEQRVIEDHQWMKEYGCPFDLRELPSPEFRAHLALITGEKMREIDENEKAQDDVGNI